jgi:hypothetical protein
MLLCTSYASAWYLKEKCTFRAGKIFEHNKVKWIAENLYLKSFVICTFQPAVSGVNRSNIMKLTGRIQRRNRKCFVKSTPAAGRQPRNKTTATARQQLRKYVTIEDICRQ